MKYFELNNKKELAGIVKSLNEPTLFKVVESLNRELSDIEEDYVKMLILDKWESELFQNVSGIKLFLDRHYNYSSPAGDKTHYTLKIGDVPEIVPEIDMNFQGYVNVEDDEE